MRWRRDAMILTVTCAFAAVFGVAIGLGYVGITRQQATMSPGSALPGPVEPRTSPVVPSSAPPVVSRGTSPARAAESTSVVDAASTGAAAKQRPRAAKTGHSAAEHGSDHRSAKPKKTKKPKK